MHLDHSLGRRAGRQVQAVHILRDEHVELAAALERDEGAVAGVGLRLPRA
jgi:hypothetical protein